MEVLDIERKTLERQERERRGMFAEDEVSSAVSCQKVAMSYAYSAVGFDIHPT